MEITHLNENACDLDSQDAIWLKTKQHCEFLDDAGISGGIYRLQYECRANDWCEFA